MKRIIFILATLVLSAAYPQKGMAAESVSSTSAAGQAAAVPQDERTVSGTVLDEFGQPVIGATVSVIGTNIWTVTDIDGKFQLSVPGGGSSEYLVSRIR